MMKILKLSSPVLALLQATGLIIYISLVTLFIANADNIFGHQTDFLGPMVFLLLFVISAIVCAFIVLARTGILFWEKRYKQAFTLLGWTLTWSIIYFALALLLIFTTKASKY